MDRRYKSDQSVAIEIVGERLCRIEEMAERARISPSSVRRYVKLGLITPVTREKGCYLLREATLFRLAKIRRLREDLGINLSGIGVILDLLDRIEDLDRQLSELKLKL
ncbi:MAG: chaperone modulator CbpM [Pseudomonadota bacterium]